MALAISLFDSGTLLGLLGPLFLLSAVLVAAWAYARVHVAKAQELAITTWRQVAEAEERKADVAELEAKEQRELKHQALSLLAAERLKTDQTIVLAALGDLAKLQAETARQQKASEERIVRVVGAQTETLERIATVIVNGDGGAGH